MTVTESGTVLITGPTRGMGRALALEMAGRPAPQRPDLLLVGRPGQALTEVAAAVRAAGATAREIPCDLSRLADVRAAAAAARDLLGVGGVRSLRALVANAGVTADPGVASTDGYQLTFAVNYLAHAQLIGDLLGSFTAPARIVFLGSNTYRGNLARRMIGAPGAQWRDPADLARPAADGKPSGLHGAGVAYATSKLTILYYAHELQRHAGDGIGVSVFEPGFMPGTGLPRRQGPAVRALARVLAHLPGMPTPARSARALASVVLDDRWAYLRDGTFILRDKEIKVEPWAYDRDRERRLWQATTDLLEGAALAGT
jgi:NAD(P)-dependent dehydrogenase (short-subunit alcohol dehydrogenase family)